MLYQAQGLGSAGTTGPAAEASIMLMQVYFRQLALYWSNLKELDVILNIFNHLVSLMFTVFLFVHSFL